MTNPDSRKYYARGQLEAALNHVRNALAERHLPRRQQHSLAALAVLPAGLDRIADAIRAGELEPMEMALEALVAATPENLAQEAL